MYHHGTVSSSWFRCRTELIFKETDGKVQEELLVWRSAIGLPILCMTRWSNIVEHASIWMTHEPVVSFLGFDLSMLWIFMLCLRLIFDYATKVLVGELIFRTSALSTSLVLILMRFISIVFSSCYVNAPPYPEFVCWQRALVISGTLVYTNCELEKKAALKLKQKKE